MAASIKNSKIWVDVVHLALTQNMQIEKLMHDNLSHERYQRLQQFSEWLLNIGNDTANIEFNNIIEIPNKMTCKSLSESEKKYHYFESNYKSISYLKERVIMSTTNEIIQDLNFKMIEQIPDSGDLYISKSHDSCLDKKDGPLYDDKFLNKLNVYGLPPHQMPIKKNAAIILIRNLDMLHGHVNGTRYIIEDFQQHCIKARKMTSNNSLDDDILFIPKIPNTTSDC